ncbi:MAG: YqeG family HAD IIIA-type phosphatase [Vulcanimicrobiota bacterium]
MSKIKRMLKPDLYHSAFWKIDFCDLSSMGIKYLIIDVDNTISNAYSPIINEEAKDALNDSMKKGFIRNACLVSNIMFGKKRVRRVADMAKELNIPFVAAMYLSLKPRRRPFLEGLKKMNALAEETAVIGDQILTDILGGNKLGCYTILIKPLGKSHWTNTLTFRGLREEMFRHTLKINLDD